MAVKGVIPKSLWVTVPSAVTRSPPVVTDRVTGWVVPRR